MCACVWYRVRPCVWYRVRVCVVPCARVCATVCDRVCVCTLAQDTVFQIADLYTLTNDPHEYHAFLTSLLSACTGPDGAFLSDDQIARYQGFTHAHRPYTAPAQPPHNPAHSTSTLDLHTRPPHNAVLLPTKLQLLGTVHSSHCAACAVCACIVRVCVRCVYGRGEALPGQRG